MNSTLNAIAVAIVALAMTAACDRKEPDAEMGSTDQTSPVTPVEPVTPVAPAPGESAGTMAPSTNSNDNSGSNTANSSSDSGDSVGNAVEDAGITTLVKAALVLESDLSAMEINVDTVNGIVTLTGAVDNAANIEKATQVVDGIEGVKSVNNQLTVKAPA